MVFFFLILPIFIFGCTGGLLLRTGFSLLEVSRGYSSLWCTGFSLQWLLLLRGMGSRHAGSVVVARGLSCFAACGIFLD